MASLKLEKYRGREQWRLNFWSKGKRWRVQLGKNISKSMQLALPLHVGRIERAAKLNGELEVGTIKWLETAPETVLAKLVESGLIKPRQSNELAAFIDGYIENRTKASPRTVLNWKDSRRRLVDHFGELKKISSITVADAITWREKLVNSKTKIGKKEALSDSTVSKAVKHAKQFFGYAMMKGLIAENPFKSLVAGGEVNKSREFFVTRDMTKKIMDVCPDHEARLLLALCRFGGLRCDSETHGLRWRDVDLASNRMIVHAPKTKRKKPTRVVPIFPELRPYLVDSLAVAKATGFDPNAFVLSNRERSAVYSQFVKLRRKANVVAYDRLFHNLRASRFTELFDAKFPIQAVCEWLGNDPETALKHYMQLTPQHLDRATSQPTGEWTDIVGTNEGTQPDAPEGNPTSETPTEAENIEQLPHDSKPCTPLPTLKIAEIFDAESPWGYFQFLAP